MAFVLHSSNRLICLTWKKSRKCRVTNHPIKNESIGSGLVVSVLAFYFGNPLNPSVYIVKCCWIRTKNKHIKRPTLPHLKKWIMDGSPNTFLLRTLYFGLRLLWVENNLLQLLNLFNQSHPIPSMAFLQNKFKSWDLKKFCLWWSSSK